MRSFLVLSLLAAAAPLAAQQDTGLTFLRQQRVQINTLTAYQVQSYRPLRLGEVRSAGFLTEGHPMPFGEVMGPVRPEQVRSTQVSDIAMSGAKIAVHPPAGASYQRGDTVMLAMVVPGDRQWGDIVIPTGIARIGDQDPRQTLATVLETYGPIRAGQVVLPMEHVSDPGRVIPVKAAGPTGSIIKGRETRELAQPGGVMFIDMGQAAGVRPGDFVQIRSRPSPRVNAADTIDELIATAEVIHVSEKSSTIKLISIVSPNITPGTPVVRVATLPN